MKKNKGQFRKGHRNSPATEFKPGDIPFNKGIKQSEWMSEESIKRSMKTRFKKGNLPATAKPLGYVSCCEHYRNGKFVGYDWFINTNWKGERHNHYNYRKYLWEIFHNEDAPKGMIFVAKDGDSAKKPTLDNVEMITRAENLRRNNPRLKFG